MRWVDGLAHRRQPRYLFMGESVSCVQLARMFGISRQAMSQGLKSGWTMAQLERRYRKQQAENETIEKTGKPILQLRR